MEEILSKKDPHIYVKWVIDYPEIPYQPTPPPINNSGTQENVMNFLPTDYYNMFSLFLPLSNDEIVNTNSNTSNMIFNPFDTMNSGLYLNNYGGNESSFFNSYNFS